MDHQFTKFTDHKKKNSLLTLNKNTHIQECRLGLTGRIPPAGQEEQRCSDKPSTGTTLFLPGPAIDRWISSSWLVVWNILQFSYIENNHPELHRFFRGAKLQPDEINYPKLLVAL